MTTYDKSTLKAYFQTGDVPTGADYGNLIDSQVNVAETSSQTMIGALVTTELITPRVSCSNLIVTGTFSAATFSPASINTNSISANTANIVDLTANKGNITVSSLSVIDSIIVSAASAAFYNGMHIQGGTLSFNNGSRNTGFRPGGGALNVVTVSGVTQATANVVSAKVLALFVNGVTNGVATGLRIKGGQDGYMQWIYNPTTSANLYPNVGGTINALAANAPYPLLAGSLTTLLHVTGSAFAASS